MESRAALGAAAALALTVTGGVSALFLAVGQASGAENAPTIADTAVTVEYVDQYGNPVAPPTAEAGATAPEVILVNPDGTIANAGNQATEADGYEPDMHEEAEYEESEYEESEDGEYEEGEHEEEDHEEEDHEEEYEEDEYAAGGHVEDEDSEYEDEDHKDD